MRWPDATAIAVRHGLRVELADEILCLANAEREACGATAGDEGETGRVLQVYGEICPAD